MCHRCLQLAFKPESTKMLKKKKKEVGFHRVQWIIMRKRNRFYLTWGPTGFTMDYDIENHKYLKIGPYRVSVSMCTGTGHHHPCK